MHPVQLSQIDLNLLLVADALLDTRSVTEAATIVNRSQPAVSRALGRLREHLADPLLVREGRTMVLTPMAQHLRPRLRSALLHLERALVDRAPFDPSQATGVLTIASSDYASVVFLARASEHLAERSRGLELAIVPYREPFEKMLEADDVDVVVGPRPSTKPWIQSERLFSSGWAVVAAKGHPWFRERTLEGLCAADHVQVNPGGGPGLVEAALARLGQRRRVRIRVPDFAGAFTIAAQSNLVVVVPRRVGEAAARVLPLDVAEFPAELASDEVFVSRHAARADDPRMVWFYDLVFEVVADEG